jgi:hypothetical protein
MVAGRGRRCAGAAAAALLTVIAAGAVPHAVDASRDSAIVLSGYQTGVAVDSSGGSDSQTISINLEPDTPPFPQKITLDVPKGYTLDLSAKPGTVIGLASITIFGVDTPSLATGLGTLVAKDAKGSATDRCLNQKGESSLMITGEGTSAGFYKIANRADTPTIEEAFGVSRVYATPRQAGRAFDHEARISTIRCEAKGGTNPDRITPRKIAAPARVRAFRAVFTFDEIDATVNYDVVFLQRGRSVTILTFVFFNAGDDLERSVTSALAKRMR